MSPDAESLPASTPRSCVICRRRKVRCDKLSPSCTNCRRAKIACVYPSTERPRPKWARRLERSVTTAPGPSAINDVGDVMDRVQQLEGLVKDLNQQLEVAKAQASLAATSPASTQSLGSSLNASASSSTGTTASHPPQHFGRLVSHDSNRSRYIGTGFWSRVNDEVRHYT